VCDFQGTKRRYKNRRLHNDIPPAPDISQAPDIPYAPDIPHAPDIPYTPDIPHAPDIPQQFLVILMFQIFERINTRLHKQER